jgi:hypothetical protein
MKGLVPALALVSLLGLSEHATAQDLAIRTSPGLTISIPTAPKADKALQDQQGASSGTASSGSASGGTAGKGSSTKQPTIAHPVIKHLAIKHVAIKHVAIKKPKEHG